MYNFVHLGRFCFSVSVRSSMGSLWIVVAVGFMDSAFDFGFLVRQTSIHLIFRRFERIIQVAEAKVGGWSSLLLKVQIKISVSSSDHHHPCIWTRCVLQFLQFSCKKNFFVRDKQITFTIQKSVTQETERIPKNVSRLTPRGARRSFNKEPENDWCFCLFFAFSSRLV